MQNRLLPHLVDIQKIIFPSLCPLPEAVAAPAVLSSHRFRDAATRWLDTCFASSL